MLDVRPSSASHGNASRTAAKAGAGADAGGNAGGPLGRCGHASARPARDRAEARFGDAIAARTARKHQAVRIVRLDRACGHIRGRSCDRRAPRRRLAPAMAGPEGASPDRQRLKLSAHRFVSQQYRKPDLLLNGMIEQAMVECPDRGLCPVVGADLSQDGLHMGLHGRFSDPEEPGGLLV